MAKKNKVPKNYFSFHLTTLRWVGINIFDIENPCLRILYNIYAAFLIITTFVGFTIVELWAVIENIKDIETCTFILCYWITHFMGCLKGLIFMMNKRSIRKYLKSFEEGVFIPDTARGGEREINIIRRAISVATMQANAFYLMAGAAITNRVVYACRDSATIETIYDPVTNTTTTSIERTLPWYSWFWFDTRPTPNYQIAFFYQVWCISLFGVEIGVLDTLISAMLVHLNAQFSILNNAILTVTERAERMQMAELETDGKTNSDIIDNNITVITHSNDNILEDGWEEIPKNNPVLSRYLDASVSSCLAHHLKIIDLSNNVEDQFNLMLLVQVLGSSLIFCFQLFQLSQMHLFTTTFMNMCTYFVLMLFQLSIYCYNGNEISMQSEQISVAAYNTDWFGAEDSIKKNLILMMVRAQRPIKISAGKFVFLSLATLMNIVRGSVSYYMFLHRMND